MANPIYFGVEALVLAMLAKPWRNIGFEDKALTVQSDEEDSSARVTV